MKAFFDKRNKCQICHWRASSLSFMPNGCNVFALFIRWASRAFLTESRLLRMSSIGIRRTSLIEWPAWLKWSDTANSKMFRVNTFVNFLFSFIGDEINKPLHVEINPCPSLKLSKHEIVWKQHATFLNRARDSSKRYGVTKAFFALKGRTDITWNIRVWYRTDESELENGLYHADNARTHAFVLKRKYH